MTKLSFLGLSPKAVLAFLFPLIAAVGTAAVSWIASGAFSTTDIKTAAGGLVLSGLALLGAYLGEPNAKPVDELKALALKGEKVAPAAVELSHPDGTHV